MSEKNDSPQSSSVQQTETADVTRLRPSKPCPICEKPSIQAFHPFCSVRCANVDLNRWLTGAYVIPASDDEEHAETEDFGDNDI